MMDLSQSTLAELASSLPAAARVFRRHALDFCCRGGRTLAEACAARALDPSAVAAEIERESAAATEPSERWAERPLEELVNHILDRFHEPLRPELARLVELARKVERVHGDKPSCPRGLADHLAATADDLEAHLMKEEQVLFPLILRGGGRSAGMPIRIMTLEHEGHGDALRRTRELTGDLVPPPEACASWKALYLGLEQLEADLFEHIHLENNVLFPRALRA